MAFALVASAASSSGFAYAADQAAWLAARQAEYATWRNAHPGVAAEIGRLKEGAARALRVIKPLGPSDQADLSRPTVTVLAPAEPIELWDEPAAPRMVVVPAGEFTMGSAAREAGRDSNEGPQRRVRIGYPFAVGKYAVTVGEFAQFVTESGDAVGNVCYVQPAAGIVWLNTEGRTWRDPDFAQGDNSPVSCVSWKDTQAYVAWLSKKTGRTYRLLSEAEFEYADRGGTTTTFWWGNDPRTACRYANEADLDTRPQFPTWPAADVGDCHDGYVFTSPVGSFKPNGFGLFDMSGNLWTWIEDCWNDNYQGAPTDGSANLGGDCRHRVFRGGSWSLGPMWLRAAQRGGRDARSGRAFRDNGIGFRVARTL